jgi:tripartite-type tricarboxylate transporter receptor subunit TctC
MEIKLTKVVANCATTALLSAFGLSGIAHAQNTAPSYPSKPVVFVVPYPAGGSTDTLSRLIAQKLSDAWHQSVVVENRTGASGIIGTEYVSRAAPDGYTLLINITTLLQAPALYKTLPYDAFKSFEPISQLASTANLFVVPAGEKPNTLPEYVSRVKAMPGKYSFGSFGAGTTSHIYGERLNHLARLDMAHIPYRGAAPLVTDLLGGQVNGGFVDVGTMRPYLESKKLKVLAVTGPKRLDLLPNVPTMSEQGYKGFEPLGFWALYAPTGTPKAIVAKVSTEVQRIMRLPEVRTRTLELGMQPVGGTPEELTTLMKRDEPVWTTIIKDSNITLN